LAAKAARGKSIDGHTMVCNDKKRAADPTTTQQPTNNGSSKGQALAGEEATVWCKPKCI
jgi:hypothetical protein